MDVNPGRRKRTDEVKEELVGIPTHKESNNVEEGMF